MKILPLIIFQLVLLGCHSTNNKTSTDSPAVKQNVKSTNDSIIEKVTKKASEKIAPKINELKSDSSNKLIGMWSAIGEENATFNIRKSTIFYPDDNKLYKYKIVGDSIKIYYDDLNQSFRYKFIGVDTLTLSGVDGPSRFYRFKK